MAAQSALEAEEVPRLTGHDGPTGNHVMRPSLDEIGRKYRTDKSSLHHNYLPYYETLFAPFRDGSFDMLEIGVDRGASIRTWHEYFSNARIVGVDIEQVALPTDLSRFELARGSQGDLQFLRSLLNRFDFRLVIDDGSHFWNHQIFTFETIFPWLRPGSIYICEDLQTGFGDLVPRYQHGASENASSYFLRIAERLAAGDEAKSNDIDDPMLESLARSVRSLTFVKHCVIVTNNP